MYRTSFDKFYIIIARCKDMCGRYFIQKSNSDHFQLQFAIIDFGWVE